MRLDSLNRQKQAYMSNDAFFHCDVPDLEIHLCRNCFSGDKENLSDKYDQDEGCFIGHEAKLPGLAQGYYLASIRITRVSI